MTSPFAAGRQAAVAAALQAAFGTPEADSVTPLSGGLSGAGVFRIRVGGVPYALRVEGAVDAFNDPARWYPAMRTAAESYLAPRVFYAEASDGVAITEFIEERSLAMDYLGTRGDLVVELGQTLRLLHETPAFAPLGVPYLDALEMIIDRFRQTGLMSEEAFSPCLAAHRAVAERYRALAPDPVSSHNDLNPRNVIYDGRRIWLVDWQSAFLADRHVDLAAASIFFTRGADEEDLLLRTYFGADPGSARRARQRLARQIGHMFYGMMFLSGAAAEQPGAHIDSLDAPSLGELHGLIGEGEPVLETWSGRLAYGLAHLRAVACEADASELERAMAIAA